MPTTDARLEAAFNDLSAPRAHLPARERAILADQITIAQIAAPTGNESRRATWIRQRLGTLLDDVRVDDAGNVVGVRRGRRDDAPVVVCAHLDTVFDADVPLETREERGRIIGPGIVDNARGLAATIAVAEALHATGTVTARPIVFAATTGEEGTGDLRGARYLFETTARGAHAAIAVDGAGDERVVSCALGCRRYRVELQGPGGHSWAAFGMPNAIHAAAGIVARLSALSADRRPRTTLTVSRIAGGSAVNAIPSAAWLDVDMRSTSPVELARLDRQLHTSMHDAVFEENSRRASGTPALSVTAVLIGDRPPGEISADSGVVRLALAATRTIGRTPELAVASTDANVPISLGIPAVAIGGGGRGGDTHTPHEWYEDRDGTLGVIRALLVIGAMAGA
jgi:acetylornithine deacetylase/succinyl-diaminopimelate desuccinylase-like protein